MVYISISLAFVVAAVVLWKLSSYLNNYVSSALLRQLPGPSRESFLVGNMRQFLACDGADFQKHVALDYGAVVKLSGYLGRPLLYISDPKALHYVLIKQENVFQEVETFSILNMKTFGPGLLSTLGHQHGKQRKLMNPVFSVNHMRHMLPVFYSVCRRLQDAIAARLQDERQEIDVLHWMGRAALEIIGQAGLGHSFDSLVEDRGDPYGQAVKAFIPNLNPLLHYRWLVVLVHKMSLPAWLQRAMLSVFPAHTTIARLVAAVDTMDTSARRIYNNKKSAYERGDAKTVEQMGREKDIISILIRANAQTVEKERLSEEEVIAQLTTLIFAAMDTSSNTLSRMLQLLAEHPEVQSKLRQELQGARAAEGLSYEELNKLSLLDCVCRETLRLYPVAASNRFRVAATDTVLPLSEPISLVDGEAVSELPIPAGTNVIIGILGSNLNKALWGNDSEEWRPERWLSPPPPALTNARIPGVYSNLLTFIGGKRACIGFKFAEMEIKVVLATLISHFTFELSDKPIVWNNSSITFPSLADGGNKPALPMKVSLYRLSEGEYM